MKFISQLIRKYVGQIVNLDKGIRTIDVRATEVEEGDIVTCIAVPDVTFFRKRPILSEQRIDRVNGRWPKATYVQYDEIGEGDGPTVYLRLGDRHGVFCLPPESIVSVATDRHHTLAA